VHLSKYKPRRLGIWAFTASLPIWIHSTFAAVRRNGTLSFGGLQADLSAVTWLIIVITSVLMITTGQRLISMNNPLFNHPVTNKIRYHLKTGAIVLVLFLFGVGVRQQVSLGWKNTQLTFEDLNPPDVQGAKWIEAHTPADAVVLTRHYAIVYYYSHRKVYWFPPISKPAVLLDGIRKRHVNYVLVVRRKNSFYLPSDEDCFKPLLEAYPEAVHLVVTGKDYSVYEVRQVTSHT
jgi:hypothetical protein